MFARHLLSDAAVEAIGQSVLTILERVGVLCQNEEMLRALDRFGARVDMRCEQVRFPQRLVKDFVQGLQAEAGSHPVAEAAFTPPPPPTLGTQVAQFYYDDERGEALPGSRELFIRLIKLGDALHPEAGVGHCLLLREVPPLLEPLEAGLVLAEYSWRPGPPFAWDVRQVDYLLEMGEIIGRPNWFTMGAICFAHPLRFDRDVANRFVRMAKLGLPIGLTGMQVAGATTPVTVAGFVAVSAAEFLATWIAGRALNPNAPLGGIIWPGTVDMKSGTVSYSAPDALLRGFATSEFLRRWCGLSIRVGGGEYSAAKVPGLYTALEKAYKAMTIAAFTGYHPPVGEGMLDCGRIISPVQLLLDREFNEALRSLAGPVLATADEIGLEEILAIGFGLQRSHLDTEHTLRHFRRSLWLPQLIERSGWAGFADEQAALERARARVHALVEAYRKPNVDADKLARMRAVVEKARAQLLS